MHARTVLCDAASASERGLQAESRDVIFIKGLACKTSSYKTLSKSVLSLQIMSSEVLPEGRRGYMTYVAF